MRSCQLRELGRIDYAKALELQQDLARQRKQGQIGDQLLLLEHAHVITLGRNGRMENLLAAEATSPTTAPGNWSATQSSISANGSVT